MNRPRMIVLFDAVGTVIKPEPDVNEVYYRLGIKYGSRLSRSAIGRRITESRRRIFNLGESAEARYAALSNPFQVPDELNSDDEIEREMWRQLVGDVFRDLESPDELFDELWDHFERPEHWRVYADVEACWEELQRHGIEIGLASNFDSRLTSIAAMIGPLSSASFVFCSAQIGFRKPSPLFYQQVESAIRCVGDDPNRQLAILMVGDDFENDFVAPRLAGWNSVWLNRERPIGSESSFGARQKREVTSLFEFTQWVLESRQFSGQSRLD